MSGIGGQKKENTNSEYVKSVGLFEAKVIAVNPTAEEYKTKLDIQLKEDSKATEYLGESRDGNTFLRIDFWLEEVKNGKKFKVTFFLEDKIRENKDSTKKQYINNVGICSWASDPNNLPEWFARRDYREAYQGEEDFYNFMRTWLSNLDYRDAATTLQLEWKKLMKGQIKDIKDQINGEYCNNIVALSTIVSKEKDGEIKEYEVVYNKGFLSPYSLKQFRLVDYDNENIQLQLSLKESGALKAHERFVVNLTGEYGCKDFFILKDLRDYDPKDNITASNAYMESSKDYEDDGDY